jgi:hypothetical protein
MPYTEPQGLRHARWEAARLLGVAPNSPPDAVRAAFRAAVKRSHPDLFVGRPDAQRAAEERLRALNAAYRLLLTTPPDPNPARPPICPLHAADMVYQCRRCGRAACAQCLVGDGCRQCRRWSRRSGKSLDKLWLWGILVAGGVGAHLLAWSPGTELWGLWGFLALVGGSRLGRGPWPRCLWVLVFPVSFPIAGAWHLLTPDESAGRAG